MKLPYKMSILSIPDSDMAVTFTPCVSGRPELFLGASIYVTITDNVWCISFQPFFKVIEVIL